MSSVLYRICIDQCIANNKNFIITDNIKGIVSHDIDRVKRDMIKLISDTTSKSPELNSEECNDGSIAIFAIDKDGNKLYHAFYYITEVVGSDEYYRYRNFDVYKRQDKWYIRADGGAIISYKSELCEALLYIDYFIATMKNIEFFNKCIQIADELLQEGEESSD